MEGVKLSVIIKESLSTQDEVQRDTQLQFQVQLLKLQPLKLYFKLKLYVRFIFSFQFTVTPNLFLC
jgi:hypothetical protein